MPASASERPSARLPAIDTARGFAMVLVCLSHFVWSATQTLGDSRIFDALTLVSMVATPTFLMVSGITLGYLRGRGGDGYRRLADKLPERGLLLLTVVHLLMLPALHLLAREPGQAMRMLPVTDTIGVCLLLGPFIVTRLDARARGWLAGAVLAVAWGLLYAAPRTEGVARVILEALIGSRRPGWWVYLFPILPWFSAYLIGTVVGGGVAARPSDERTALPRVLLTWAAALAWGAVAIELAVVALASASPSSAGLANFAATFGSPLQKLPPTPPYLLTYGAAGLLMTATTSIWMGSRGFGWISRRAGEIGRASLVVFVVQAYLFYLIELHYLPPGRRTWPLYFLASIAVVYATARLWLAAGGNSLLVMPGYSRVRGFLSGRTTARRTTSV